ncbi:hypothetical protein D9M71_672740 [compost metagenome]
MLATPAILATVDIAAGKAAKVIDPRDRLPVDRLRRRLQRVMLEQGKRHGESAAGKETAAQGHVPALHTQGIGQRTFGVRAVGLTGHAQSGAAQRLIAQLRISAQTHQFVAGQQVGLRLDVQRRPGIPLRRQGDPIAPDAHSRSCDDQQDQQQPPAKPHRQPLKN